MSREKETVTLGIKPKVAFRGFVVAGCEPDEMGIGPVFAVPRLLSRHGLAVKDIDLWELNEAFAVQVIYCRDRLGIEQEKLNVNGGSIAIGHPFGMTGWRLVGTLANQMRRRFRLNGAWSRCALAVGKGPRDCSNWSTNRGRGEKAEPAGLSVAGIQKSEGPPCTGRRPFARQPEHGLAVTANHSRPAPAGFVAS